MTEERFTFGIIGGSGALGRAIALGVLGGGVVAPERFWISNRGGGAPGFERFPGVRATADNQTLVDACDVVLLCVPPAEAERVAIDASDRLVLSVMAGVDLARIGSLSGSRRTVRAMSSPAAALGLAYSPWFASEALGRADRRIVERLLGACGLTDELEREAHIELFTAMTGPVPGFVAFYAECMVCHASSKGVEPGIADRAVRQLFRAAGQMMADGPETPAEHVRAMIDYAGTTAAGLETMRASSIAEDIARGLGASEARARTIGRDGEDPTSRPRTGDGRSGGVGGDGSSPGR